MVLEESEKEAVELGGSLGLDVSGVHNLAVVIGEADMMEESD